MASNIVAPLLLLLLASAGAVRVHDVKEEHQLDQKLQTLKEKFKKSLMQELDELDDEEIEELAELEGLTDSQEDSLAPEPLSAPAPMTASELHQKLDTLQLGPQPGPLIPELVPGRGQTFEVANHERVDFIESNEYVWKLVNVVTEQTTSSGIANGPETTDAYDKTIATTAGGFFSNIYGYKTVHIRNNKGEDMFRLRRTKMMLNPFKLHWSFHVTPPNSKDVLFTIYKDIFGTGFLGWKAEFRVYQGRKRDGKQIYHCVKAAWWTKCYHSKADYKAGQPAVAEFSKSVKRDVSLVAPDRFSLKVKEGEDTALLLTTTTVMDMAGEIPNIR